MEKIELYKILTIEQEDGTDKNYTVANKLVYNNTTYLYLIEVDQEENLIENNQMLAKVVEHNQEQYVEKITEEAELKEVAKLFFELFKESMDESTIK